MSKDNGDKTPGNSDKSDTVVEFKKPKIVHANDNGPGSPPTAPAKTPEAYYTFDYYEGEPSIGMSGWLSFGPMFVAVVDAQDLVKLVVPAGSFKCIWKSELDELDEDLDEYDDEQDTEEG